MKNGDIISMDDNIITVLNEHWNYLWLGSPHPQNDSISRNIGHTDKKFEEDTGVCVCYIYENKKIRKLLNNETAIHGDNTGGKPISFLYIIEDIDKLVAWRLSKT